MPAVAVLSKLLAVVRAQNDEGAVVEPGGAEVVEQAAEGVVVEGDFTEVARPKQLDASERPICRTFGTQIVASPEAFELAGR